MTTVTTQLPSGFEPLEPFVEFWAATSAAGRAHCRDVSQEPEREAFFDVAAPLAAQALDYLDQKPLAEHNDEEKRLMRLILSFGHVAMAVELQREEEGKHTKWRPFMRITTTPADE